MGPPPKYLIERKLIRSISKKVLPSNPLIPPEYFNGLMNCWKTYGVGSSKCVQEELKYDFAQSEKQKFKQKLQQMNLKQIVNSELKRPVYHFERKGRHSAYRRANFALIDLHSSLI